MNRERFESQMAFLKEIDKVKSIVRRTRLLDNSRYENDTEHSWHLAIMALVLLEHANAKDLDVLKTIKMVLIHDIVEIDAGDAFLYGDAAAKEDKKSQERRAASRIFGLLPADQEDECRALWEEFDARETPEARYAAALDRFEPIIQNASTGGHAWLKYGISRDQAEIVNRHIEDGSEYLWQQAKALLAECERSGFFPSESV